MFSLFQRLRKPRVVTHPLPAYGPRGAEILLETYTFVAEFQARAREHEFQADVHRREAEHWRRTKPHSKMVAWHECEAQRHAQEAQQQRTNAQTVLDTLVLLRYGRSAVSESTEIVEVPYSRA